ncbi:hypothetical protein ASF33_18280 [Methylobacterium sp. Leaf92]|nr:hypothetical protein ASF33_18280 [Methylobacterium sp. Leaf92]
MARSNYADARPPQTFAEIRGQEHATRFLSRLIQRGQIARPILFEGAYGAGKTSLARLYARGLNCHKPRSCGSPCGGCPACTTNTGFHEYDTPLQGGSRANVLRFVQDHACRTSKHKYEVLFFDEAHALERNAAESLLKTVEEPPQGVTFCFATTEPDQIIAPLRSRLRSVVVKPLSAQLAVRLLRERAAADELAYDPAALALLAGLKQGHPRDLLNGLGQLRDLEPDRITVKLVREVFDVDHDVHLLAYVAALADGDEPAQVRTWFAWQEQAATKIVWLEAFLASLYYNNILGEDAVVDALVASIEEVDRRPILERFRRRLGLERVGDLAGPWRRMMAFWATQADDPASAALELRVAVFQDLVNARLVEPAQVDPGRGVTQRPAPAPFPRTPTPDELATARAPDAGYLEAVDVQRIVAIASFLPQEHGVLFNAHFEMRPGAYGCDEEASARALIEAFCGDLQVVVASWSEGLFARLTLFTRDPDRGGDLRGLIVAHLPEGTRPHAGIDVADHIGAWCRAWRAAECADEPGDAISFAFGPSKAGKAIRFHWKAVMALCAGLDTDVSHRDPREGRVRPLRELLREAGPVSWRRAGPVSGPLFSVSSLLAPGAIDNTCAHGMELLSAFDAGAWNHLRTGWELMEYYDRLALKAERRAKLEEIAEIYGSGTPQTQAAQAELIAAWVRPAEERRHTWSGGWWPRAEA